MKLGYFAGLLLAFAGLTSAALAQDAGPAPHVPLQKSIGRTKPTGPVPSLAVINSQGATLENNKLTLTGVSKNSIVFADRPVRAAGHVMTEQFIMQWDEGKDNFAIDPPNATVSVLGGDGSSISDAVVTLKSPKLEGTTLTFDVAVLEGSLAGASGPAALFIDHFGGGGGGFHGGGFGGYGGGMGGFHGTYAHVGDATYAHVGDWHGGNYWHAPVYHGAWYAGAAGFAAGALTGAALAAPYYDHPYYAPPYCGYYPYPPCY
jgi:hypothetical protein